MKCKPMFLLLVLFIGTRMFVSAQIRDYIPIVRPVYHAETIEFLQKLSDSLKKEGYDSAAAVLKAYSKGGFGSGFVFVSKDGTNYVITNRHVVNEAASVTLEFQKGDGSQVVYKECSIVAIDESLDLALISFPQGSKPFKKGLAFFTDSLEDSMEVWSAGYPALGDNPSWQLGKGTITNVNARIPQLVNTEITSLIQHSAIVDAGNSGGPLLLADPGSEMKYKVIGINTWKAINRQAANFAIPAASITKFIDSVLTTATMNTSQTAILENRSRDFIGVLFSKDAYKNIAPYISYSFVATKGEIILKEVLSKAPTTVREEILDVFIHVSPIEGIKLAIAYRIGQYFSAGESTMPFTFVAIDGNPDAKNTEVPVRFKLQNKEISLSWVREYGYWRLSSFPFDTSTGEKENKKQNAISTFTYDEIPFTFLIRGGYIASLSGEDALYDFAFHLKHDAFLAYGFSFAGKETKDSGTNNTGYMVEPGLEGFLQLPIHTTSLLIMPQIGAKVGPIVDTAIALDSTNETGFSFCGIIKGGVSIGFGEETKFLLGVDYRHYIFGPNYAPKPGVEIWLGIGR